MRKSNEASNEKISIRKDTKKTVQKALPHQSPYTEPMIGQPDADSPANSHRSQRSPRQTLEVQVHRQPRLLHNAQRVYDQSQAYHASNNSKLRFSKKRAIKGAQTNKHR